jgi:HPt (histidine-containing phosphotransfer) domain-containing protein
VHGPEPAVDLAAVRERIGGDEDLLKELVALYFEDEHHLLEEVRQAIDSRDAERLRRSAHTLKGAVANFSAPRAHAAALALEMAGRDGRLEHAEPLLAALRAELDDVRLALAAHGV